MPIDPNWARWIFASVAKALKDVVADEENLAVLVEQLDERTAAFEQASSKAEIRITGPSTQELSKGYFRNCVDINVLLTVRNDGAKKNAYEFVRYAGLFQEAMSSPIGVWNYGNQDGDYVSPDADTLVFIGCLKPRPGIQDSTKVLHFGQIDTTSKLSQTMVDARYVMYLPEE